MVVNSNERTLDKISRGAVCIYQPAIIIIIRIITARETLKFTFLYKQNVLEEFKRTLFNHQGLREYLTPCQCPQWLSDDLPRSSSS